MKVSANTMLAALAFAVSIAASPASADDATLRAQSTLVPDNPPAGSVLIEPFLRDFHSQWQPYNDYAPVYDVNGTNSFRGRCSCGCVATAAAQVFHHLKWPARIDRVFLSSNKVIAANCVTNDFPLRFDGHVPMDWDAIAAGYFNKVITNFVSETRYVYGPEHLFDRRGTVAESVRFPVSRLVLWCDALSEMVFAPEDSSANYDTVAGKVADWYTPGRWLALNTAEGRSQALASLGAGVPFFVGLNSLDGSKFANHMAVASGWASDGTDDYVYLNMGWGGDSDGWYNTANALSTTNEMRYSFGEAYVGHYPRAKPQLDPLPNVCATNGPVSIGWHFPDVYTNNLDGFVVTATRVSRDVSAYGTDFSGTPGVSSTERIRVSEDPEHGHGRGRLLYIEALAEGTYTFDIDVTLTSASELSFDYSSFFPNWTSCELQASFDGGEWQTVFVPTFNLATVDVDSNQWYGFDMWRGKRLYLGDHGGQSARFRILKGRTGTSYFPGGRILFDNFSITDILESETDEFNVTPESRSVALTDLAPGLDYKLSVRPVISGVPVQGEASEPVVARMEGEHQRPAPGELSYSLGDVSFADSSPSDGVWSYRGALDDGVNGVSSPTNASIACELPGVITADSVLTFNWAEDGKYYGIYSGGQGDYDCYGVFYVEIYLSDNGGNYCIFRTNNVSAVVEPQPAEISLAQFAGYSGRIEIKYARVGYSFVGGYGALYAPRITGILDTVAPPVQWTGEDVVAHEKPEILSVSEVSEGFYADFATNTMTFTVVCSPSVTRLAASSSHPSLVGEHDIAVSSQGDGVYSVVVTPGGVNKTNSRSRMIMTLVASNEDGTSCHKDLSLRFESEADEATGGGDTPTIPDGAEYVDLVEITLDAAGGTCETTSVLKAANAQIGTLPEPSYPGYSFAGWWTELSGGTEVTNETVVTSDATYYAHWTNRLFTVLFDAAGGTCDTASVQRQDGGAIGPLPEAAFAGYTFAGWWTGVDGGTEVTNETVVAADTTCYAHWTANVYTVSFDAAGGVCLAAETNVTYGGVYGDIPAASREGFYAFAGWWTAAEGGDEITAATVLQIASNHVLYAHWTDITPVYTIAFDPNGGICEAAETNIAHGSVYGTLPAAELAGYSFVGWWTEPEGGSQILATTVVVSPATNHAHWTANVYTVSFDAAGGACETAEKDAQYDSPYGELPVPSLAEHLFAGWWTEAEGGDEVTSATTVQIASNHVLYAHWSDPDPGYDVLDGDDIEEPYWVEKSVSLPGAVYDGSNVVGVIELKLGKVNQKNHTGKVSGSLIRLDGKKHSIVAKTVDNIYGTGPATVSLDVKGLGKMTVTIGGTRFAGSLAGDLHVQSAAVGGAWEGASATVAVAMDKTSMFPGIVVEELIPFSETAGVKGGKWSFDKAAGVKWTAVKSGMVVLVYDDATGKGLVLDESGGKTNRSGMKLSYTPKKGTFKGSFKLYALQMDGAKTKLVKYTVNVAGVVVDRVGWGVATCKKFPSAEWPVSVK